MIKNFLNSLFTSESKQEKMPEIKSTYTAHFEGKDVVFVDLSWINHDNDDDNTIWENYCEDFCINNNLDKWGSTNGICQDVSDVYKQYVIDTDNGSVLGCIELDSYILGCLDLEKVLELDPDCFNNSNPPVIIKNFTGDITFYTTTEYIEEYDEERDIVTITGTGTQNFCSEFYDKLIEKGYQLDD